MILSLINKLELTDVLVIIMFMITACLWYILYRIDRYYIIRRFSTLVGIALVVLLTFNTITAPILGVKIVAVVYTFIIIAMWTMLFKIKGWLDYEPYIRTLLKRFSSNKRHS